MRKIYGFIEKNPENWGDIFEDDDKSPEVLISSACHVYITEKGEMAIGFDMSLGITKRQMNTMLSDYCSSPKVIEVV